MKTAPKTFAEAFPTIDTIGGFYEQHELQLLWNAVRGLHTCRGILEIGVEKGRSMAAIALAARSRGFSTKIYAIDNFSTYPDGDIAAEFWSNMSKIDQFVNMFAQSTSAVKLADLPGSVSFLHIDGGHDYDTVLHDAMKFGPLVHRGGKIAFHDYGRESLPEVKEAVDRWAKFKSEYSWMKPYSKSDSGTTLVMERVA